MEREKDRGNCLLEDKRNLQEHSIFFKCVFGKEILKGKGVVMDDFQERGAHDYREDAILTLQEFERIVLRCIIHYNCERPIENYPYTPEMLDANVSPYANAIWNWKKENTEANLIEVSRKEMVLTLLPRAKGRFTRRGLTANGLRYFAEGYKEQYLAGGEVTVAYDPKDCMPVSAAFEVGRRYMLNTHPSITIFDENNGFFETLKMGVKADDR